MKLKAIYAFKVRIIDPTTIKYTTSVDGEEIPMKLSKTAAKSLHKLYNISVPMSTKLYNLDYNLWLEVLSMGFAKRANYESCGSTEEDSSDYPAAYLITSDIDNDIVLDIIDSENAVSINQNIEKFNDFLQTENHSRVIPLSEGISYKVITMGEKNDNKEAFLSIVMDFHKSRFEIRSGVAITMDDHQIFIPDSKPIMRSDTIRDILPSELTYELGLTNSLVRTGYSGCLKENDADSLSSIKVSVREILDILSRCKLSLIYDSNNDVLSITDFENNDIAIKICDFLLSWSYPFMSLKRLTNTEKSMLITNEVSGLDITLYDLLEFLSEVLLMPTGVTSEEISRATKIASNGDMRVITKK